MKISVIVPTHNKAEYLDLTLSSFLAQTRAPDEIIVVDDGSSDGTGDVIRHYEKKLPIHACVQKCEGRARARNAGLKKATGDIIIFCDDDRIAAPDFIAQHVDALQHDPLAVCVGWKKRALTIWRNFLPMTPNDFETIRTSTGFALPYMLGDKWEPLVSADTVVHDFEAFRKRYVIGDEIDNQPGAQTASAQLMPWMWGTTANLSFRRNQGEPVFFDEAYKGWGVEDVDFCLGLVNQGYHIKFTNDALNYHQIHRLGDVGLRDAKADRMRQANINLNHFCEKHRTLEAHLFRRVQQGMDANDAAEILNHALQDKQGIVAEELRILYAQQTFSSGKSNELRAVSGNYLVSLDTVQDYIWQDEENQLRPVPATQQTDGRLRPATPRATARMQDLPITHKWWTPMLWQADDERFCEYMYAAPLSFQAVPDGMKVGYPRETQVSPDNRTFELPFRHDLTIRSKDKLSDRHFGVEGYSDRTVDVSWSGRDGELHMRAIQGCPSVHFWVQGRSDLEIAFEDDASFEAMPDRNSVIASVDGTRYLICYSNCHLQVLDTKLMAVEDVSDGLAIAVHLLPDDGDAALEQFIAQGTRKPVGGAFRWTVDHDQNRVDMHFTMHNEHGLLAENLMQTLMPHQWRRTSDLVSLGRYRSPRGAMTLVNASEFSVTMQKRGFLPYLPEDADVSDMLQPTIDQSFASLDEAALWQRPLEGASVDDGYWAGKALVRLADMANTARQFGHNDVMQRCLDLIKTKTEAYLAEGDDIGFYYDPEWATLLFVPCQVHGVAEQMNDHVYYYGYFLRAAVAVGLVDREWINRPDIKNGLLEIAADVVNIDRESERFPFLRCFDSYAGHSWGNGNGAYSQGLNAEPSSESINFAAALALLGGLIEEPAVRDLGIMLYTAECEATLDYWFNRWEDSFPDNFRQPFVGMLWGSGGSCRSWFDVRPTEALGVNLLPIQASSTYLSGNPNLQAVLDSIYEDWQRAGPRWGGLIAMAQALTDPARAAKLVETLPDKALTEWSLHPTTVRLWIETFAAIGRPVEDVSCNAPFYAVFEQEGARSYCVFNLGEEPFEARFSDGFHLTAAPRTVVTEWQPKLALSA
ncbi:glycosyl hydrolase [Rhizobium skierniewicense]|uniref:glycosyl hydrolase n=1 Tax=Rhizobium skierniewicense TaxID=984260 RepID=UPI0015728F3E|nr:glycosyl hydrolase [Rhizobium skierniewicense]NTF33878.1 glycosyltransferase [Rhizobium skierniewicense]